MSWRLAVCLAAAPVLAACGTASGGGGQTASDAVHAAVQATLDQGTAHFEVSTVVLQSPGPPRPSTITVFGDVRFQGPAARYTSMVAGSASIAPPMQIVMVGHRLYQGVPAGGTTVWQPSSATSVFPVFAVMTTQGLLSAESGTADGVGTIGGTPATKFRVHVAGGAFGPGTGRTGPAPTVQPYDVVVWVGPRNLIVRIQATQHTTSVNTGGSAQHTNVTSATTETLSDFGAPVHITAPAVSGSH